MKNPTILVGTLHLFLHQNDQIKKKIDNEIIIYIYISGFEAVYLYNEKYFLVLFRKNHAWCFVTACGKLKLDILYKIFFNLKFDIL